MNARFILEEAEKKSRVPRKLHDRPKGDTFFG